MGTGPQLGMCCSSLPVLSPNGTSSIPIEKEVDVGRYSPAFGSDLLPGVYSMPIPAVPKPGSDKLCLVTNHSASDYAPNNMISRGDIAGMTLDNVQDLASALRLYRREGGENDDLIVWKADVSVAYRHIPMHPFWQIKQVVSFEGRRHVDQRNMFGGRASQRIFHAFMSSPSGPPSRTASSPSFSFMLPTLSHSNNDTNFLGTNLTKRRFPPTSFNFSDSGITFHFPMRLVSKWVGTTHYWV